MATKDRTQLELLPSRQAIPVPITPEFIATVRQLPTFLSAFNHSWLITGLEDKEIYIDCNIDGSHFTKIKNNSAGIPGDHRFDKFRRRVRNYAMLVWLAEAEGFDAMSLRRHYISDADRRVAELEEENAALRRIVARGRP